MHSSFYLVTKTIGCLHKKQTPCHQTHKQLNYYILLLLYYLSLAFFAFNYKIEKNTFVKSAKAYYIFVIFHIDDTKKQENRWNCLEICIEFF
jgi:hypothetical protein